MNKIMRNWRNQGYHLNYGEAVIASWIRQLEPDFKTGMRIMDVGCGSGRDLCAIGKILKFKSPLLFGVSDTSVQGVCVSNVDVEICRLPYENNYFELTLCNQVYEHLKNWVWSFNELIRVTRLGGYIIIGVPNLAALHCRLQLLFGLQPACIKCDDAHVRGFARSEMIRFISECTGLELMNTAGSNFYGVPPYFAQKLGELFPSYAVSNFYLIRKVKDNINLVDGLKMKKLETNYYLG
jgi:SAM-dependent methyltransferase